MALARSYLYVPGDRPSWMVKALGSGADALILDLEDAVLAERRGAARAAVAAFLEGPAERPGVQRWVRVNPATLEQDVAAVASPALAGIVLPEVDVDLLARADVALGSAEQRLGLAAGTLRVVGLVETATALVRLAEVAAGPRLLRLGLGEADLAGALGLLPDEQRTELWPLRSAVVVASAAAGLARPVGPVHTRLDDAEGLRASTRAQLRQGFRARTTIHPDQVPVVNEVYTPTTDELAQARQVLADVEAARASGQGAVRGSDGWMHDPATVRAAQDVLSRTRSTAGPC